MWRLQGFDSGDFIRHYWQKQPCVIRQAFAEFVSPISADELAGLACEQGVHSRLVTQGDAECRWQLRYGPFGERELAALPERNYSLLVSECEKWLPELRLLLDQFRFIPDWRHDDLMISYAPPGGSVGPHVDEYDVFLLQAEGRRRWRYNLDRLDQPRLIAGLDLAVLEHFDAEHDVVLEPGDMLYLPPGRPHHGIAIDACMTWSIGFRATDAVELLEFLEQEVDARQTGVGRYADPDLETGRHHAEITDSEIARLRAVTLDFLDQPADTWRDAIGRLLTQGKGEFEPCSPPPLISDLRQGLWVRHPDTRLLYHESAGDIRFYCNGESYSLPPGDLCRRLVQALCEKQEWPSSLIRDCLGIDRLAHGLLAMAGTGAIIRDSD